MDYAYNAISQVINKYRYSDNNLVAETNHIYDNLNRLTNIIHSNGTGANIIASYSQTYDQGDRITGVTSNDGNSSYTYDDTNQLISGEYDFQDNESYSYDSNGNRTNDGYVTGVNNQLLEDNKYLYEYDLVGNRTKRTDKSTNEVMEYRWDIRDRLTGIIVKNDLGEIIRTAEYTYDVYNQRIAKTVDTDGDGSLAAVTESFVYGSDQNIALVFDENGNVNHRYLFGDGVDQIEADESNGNVLWALTDHLGSVRDVVDDSGTVLNHIVYDAFGGVTSQTDESVVFRYGYTARELDAESGLQYNRARYLDSFTGKFISEDPISFQAGDSNLYRYVFNSPHNGIDPSGLLAGLQPARPIPVPPANGLLGVLGSILAPVAAFTATFFAFTQPTADDDYFPSNPQVSKKRNPAPTPSPSLKLTPIPLPADDDYFPSNPQASKKSDRRNNSSSPFNRPQTSNRYDNPSQMCTENDVDEKNRESSIRIEVQYSTTKDYGLTATSRSKKGVTLIQLNNKINEFVIDVKLPVDKASWFDLKKYSDQFDYGVQKARDQASEANRNGGTRGYQKLSSVQWNDASGKYFSKGGVFRVELINKDGDNLLP